MVKGVVPCNNLCYILYKIYHVYSKIGLINSSIIHIAYWFPVAHLLSKSKLQRNWGNKILQPKCPCIRRNKTTSLGHDKFTELTWLTNSNKKSHFDQPIRWYRVLKCDVIKLSFLHFSISWPYFSRTWWKTLTHQILHESVHRGPRYGCMNT